MNHAHQTLAEQAGPQSSLGNRFIRSGMLACLLLLASCSTGRSPIDSEADYARAILEVRDAVKRHGQIIEISAVEFLDYLAARLEGGLARRGPSRRYRIILLGTDEILAFSPGSGYIVISQGIIGAIGNEAQLAFIVAHEIAHQELGHILLRTYHGRERADLERAADRLAIGIAALAGYDPYAAITAIPEISDLLAHNNSTDATGAADYPTAEQRIDALRQLVDDSRWQPPGTVNRREFALLKARLDAR